MTSTYTATLASLEYEQLTRLMDEQYPDSLIDQFMRPLELFIGLAERGDTRPVQLCDMTVEGRTARVYMPVKDVR